MKITDGVKLVRRVIFEQDVNTKSDGWPSRMLQAIEVAKRIGFTNFEIDVAGAEAVQSEETPKGLVFFVSDIFGSGKVEGDEWKEEKPAQDGKKERTPRIVRVWVVMAMDGERES